MSLEIVTIPCLSDNYAYLLRDAGSGLVALVDAPEPGPIEAELKERGWGLDQILITHHHPDHIGGVEALRQAFGAKVVGAAADARRLPALDRAVRPGESVAVGDERRAGDRRAGAHGRARRLPFRGGEGGLHRPTA